jgi:hypothetical protein
MLGGARDEVVPRSQMQELWAIIRNRGRDTAARSKKPPAPGVKEGDEEEGEDEKGADRSNSSPAAPGPEPGSRPVGGKVPPRVVVDGWNAYIEFADGMHSEYFALKLLCFVFS